MFSVIISPSTIYQLCDMEIDTSILLGILSYLALAGAVSFYVSLLFRFIRWIISRFKR